MHPCYREYFDKKPKQNDTSFRVKYTNSSKEFPGANGDATTRQHARTKDFRSIPEKPH